MEFFKAICAKHGGALAKWEGDGGFALFLSCTEMQLGASVQAGTSFLEELPSQNAQTAKALAWSSFPRRVRIKAHRGEVYLTNNHGLHSADPQHFDDFLKFEKKFAPKSDEFFITEQLYHMLLAKAKARFTLFKKGLRASSLRTNLYRQRRMPVAKAENIFQRGDEVSTITQADWNYLRNQITAHFANVAARNQITKGLIAQLNDLPRQKCRQGITSSAILELTLDALYSYLRVVFTSCRVRVSFWRAVQRRGQKFVKMVSYRYPKGESTNPAKRVVPVTDLRWKVSECYAKVEPVVTPCVTEARIQHQWSDFGRDQQSARRALDSAMQIPVFCERADKSKEIRGVLSLDADKPDMFLPEELALWRDDLVGFLANLALAEKLRKCRV